MLKGIESRKSPFGYYSRLDPEGYLCLHNTIKY